MERSTRLAVHKVLLLAATAAAGFAVSARLLVDEPGSPGAAGLALLCGAVLCAGLLALCAAIAGRIDRAGALVLAPAGLFVVSLLPGSLFGGGEVFANLSAFSGFAGSALFFLIAAQAGKDRELTKSLLKVALAVAAVQAALGVFQVLAAPGSPSRDAFAGTWSFSGGVAGLLAMMTPVAAGLALNSIHEKLDRSVWPRRSLYLVVTALFLAGMHFAGSAVDWTALLAGCAAGVFLAGRTYLSRNRRLAMAVAALALVAAAASVLQGRESISDNGGRGSLESVFRPVSDSFRAELDRAAADPLLGAGAAPAGRAHAAEVPGLMRVVSSFGIPAGASFALLAVFWWVIVVRGTRSRRVDSLDGVVVIAPRREVKAIEICTVMLAVGAAAFFFAGEGVQGLPPALFRLIFLPVFAIVVAGSFSYKHFHLVVDNRRDFVAIGAAAGAAAGVTRSLVGGGLWHPALQLTLFLLMGASLSRVLSEDLQPADLRRPRALRLALGIVGATAAAAAAACFAAFFGVEARKSALLSAEAGLPAAAANRTAQNIERRALAWERIAAAEALDSESWVRAGRHWTELSALLEAGGGNSGDARAKAAAAFGRARSLSRTARIPMAEGEAWLASSQKGGSSDLESAERASAAFADAIERDFSSARAAMGLGTARYRAGDRPGALAALEKALSLSAGGSELSDRERAEAQAMAELLRG